MFQTVKSSTCFDGYCVVDNTKSTVPSECLSTSGGFLKFYCRNRKGQRTYLDMKKNELDQNFTRETKGEDTVEIILVLKGEKSPLLH